MDYYLKTPVHLCEFALREGKTSQVRTYIAFQVLYSGKVNLSDKPYKTVAGLLNCSPRTVQRHVNWLLDRDWMGKDSKAGWLFVRGLDHLCMREGWSTKAVAMQYKDILDFKAFLTTAVICAIIAYQRQNESDRLIRGSSQTGWPVSLDNIAKWLNVCQKTAFNLRKMASKTGLLGMGSNLWQLSDISPADVRRMRQNHINNVNLDLHATAGEKLNISVDRLRIRYGKVFVQMPNYCKPMRIFRNR